MSQTVSTRKPGGPRARPNMALFEARVRLGLSRGELGRLAGLSEKQIGRLERGVVRYPRADTYAAIADALNRDVTELFRLRVGR